MPFIQLVITLLHLQQEECGYFEQNDLNFKSKNNFCSWFSYFFLIPFVGVIVFLNYLNYMNDLIFACLPQFCFIKIMC